MVDCFNIFLQNVIQYVGKAGLNLVVPQVCQGGLRQLAVQQQLPAPLGACGACQQRMRRRAAPMPCAQQPRCLLADSLFMLSSQILGTTLQICGYHKATADLAGGNRFSCVPHRAAEQRMRVHSAHAKRAGTCQLALKAGRRRQLARQACPHAVLGTPLRHRGCHVRIYVAKVFDRRRHAVAQGCSGEEQSCQSCVSIEARYVAGRPYNTHEDSCGIPLAAACIVAS